MMLTLVLVAVVLAGATVVDKATVDVKIKQGTIRGSWKKDPYGHHFYAFQSIPYALAPVGSLRFEVSVVSAA